MMQAHLRDIDAAYLAGLIDGEGCIVVSRTHTSSSAKACRRGFAYRSSIGVKMTDRPILDWAHKVTGLGQILSNKLNKPHYRPAWAWTVWSNEAKALAEQLLPYLRIKREQAINLIEFQSIMRLPGSKGLSDSEWLAREGHYDRSRTLNAGREVRQ